jgi:hypothetical protein
MKKIFYILTAAAIAIAVPSVAGAQDTKGGDKKPAYHKSMSPHHHHHKNMHTYHKKTHPHHAYHKNM